MNWPLALAFLFYWGAIEGWVIEFLFRNLISHKGPRGKYFINPGFCKGPWLPIYGIGLAAMFTISALIQTAVPNASPIVVILLIGITMNVIEFIGGYVLLKCFNTRLWDYRDQPGNIMGIFCPLFAVIWTVIGAAYYLLLHNYVISELEWLSNNLAFSFVIGLFWGLFAVDMAASFKTIAAVKKYGDKHDVIIKVEELKQAMQKQRMDKAERLKFFNEIAGTEIEDIMNNIDQHKHATESKATAGKSHRTKAYKESQKNN